jgi:hypothetical protein
MLIAISFLSGLVVGALLLLGFLFMVSAMVSRYEEKKDLYRND